MKANDKAILKQHIKQGDIPSLLTYLESLESESLERLVKERTDTRYYQSRIETIREVISLYNNEPQSPQTRPPMARREP